MIIKIYREHQARIGLLLKCGIRHLKYHRKFCEFQIRQHAPSASLTCLCFRPIFRSSAIAGFPFHGQHRLSKFPIQQCSEFHGSASTNFQSERSSKESNQTTEWLKETLKTVAVVATCVMIYLAFNNRRKKQDTETSKVILEKSSKELQDLSSKLTQEFNEKSDSDKITLSLQIAECELVLKRGEEEVAIKRVKDTVLKSFSLFDIVKLARKLTQEGHYAQAIILYRIIHIPIKAYEAINIPPNDMLRWISDRVTDIGAAVKPLLEDGGKSRDFALEYGLKHMGELLDDLRTIENAKADLRALTEACCLHNIAYVNIEIDDYQNVIRIGEEGLTCLEKQFGVNSKNHVINSAILNNLGLAYERLGQYADAERYYVRAIEAYKTANFDNDAQRQEYVDKTSESLAIVRMKL